MCPDCTTKRCTKCGETKDLNEFYPDPRYKGGYTTWCKPCSKAYRAEHHQKNAEQRHARCNARSRERWANDPEYRKRKNAQKAAVRSKPEEQAKRYAWGKARYERDKQDPNTRIKRRPKDRLYAHVRRARKRDNGGTFTLEEWNALCERYGNRCLCCGATGVPLHIDHVIPLARGGRNDISNLQPLCKRCNSRKYAKHIDYRPTD
jgi:5-methylcytosine-specific restriction endonuclease McrA